MPDEDATTGKEKFEKKWLLLLGLWTLPAILAFIQFYFTYSANLQRSPWHVEVSFQLMLWYLLALATPAILRLGRCFPIERPRRIRAVAYHSLFFIIFVFSFTAIIVAMGYLRPEDPMMPINSAPFFKKFQMYLSASITLCLLIYGAVLGIGHAMNYYRKFRDREREATALELRASQLERQLAQAHLQALKMQLHPHFLFNTLHSIATLVRDDDKRGAIRMIAGLSDLLRLALEEVGTREAPLKMEVEFLEKYLEIERIRFQDRLRLQMQIEPETLEAQVPYLILQPLVENAIRHGISKRAAASLVEVKAWRESDRLYLQVRDDGPGLPGDRSPITQNGIGIKNTIARLEQLYGEGQSFSMENADSGGVVAIISIPFTTNEPPIESGSQQLADEVAEKETERIEPTERKIFS